MRDVVVPFCHRNVPDNLPLKIRIEFDLDGCLAEEHEDPEGRVFVQHTKEGRIVLDGVRTEDGKSSHVPSDSMAWSSFFVPSVAVCCSRGDKSGFQLSGSAWASVIRTDSTRVCSSCAGEGQLTE